MRLLSHVTLTLVWLAVTTGRHSGAEAAGQDSCCVTYSRVRAVSAILMRGGAMQCRRQRISEQCNVEAVMLKWRCRVICVDPDHEMVRKRLAKLCSGRKVPNGRMKLGCLRRKKLKL